MQLEKENKLLSFVQMNTTNDTNLKICQTSTRVSFYLIFHPVFFKKLSLYDTPLKCYWTTSPPGFMPRAVVSNHNVWRHCGSTHLHLHKGCEIVCEQLSDVPLRMFFTLPPCDGLNALPRRNQRPSQGEPAKTKRATLLQGPGAPVTLRTAHSPSLLLFFLSSSLSLPLSLFLFPSFSLSGFLSHHRDS